MENSMPNLQLPASGASSAPVTPFDAAAADRDFDCDCDFALGCECADPALQIERWSDEARAAQLAPETH
jgi:hypothetical protein